MFLQRHEAELSLFNRRSTMYTRVYVNKKVKKKHQCDGLFHANQSIIPPSEKSTKEN